MQKKRRLASIVAAGLATGLVVLAGCTPGDDDVEEGSPAVLQECVDDPMNCLSGTGQEGGTITWMIPVPGAAWNLISGGGGSVYSLQMVSPVLPSTGMTMPDGSYGYNMDLLAEEPQLLSEDPWTFQFVIRDDAVWDDGTPIGIDDFLITWYMVMGPAGEFCSEKCATRGGETELNYESVEASEDGKTITVTMKEGEAHLEWFGDWGVGSTSSGLWPAHIAEREGYDWRNNPDDLGDYFEYLNANPPDWSGGPYRIVEGALDGDVVLERNENYYGARPMLDTIVLRVLTDSGTWVDAFRSGEIDGGSPPDLDQDVVEQLLEFDNVVVHVADSPGWEHLDWNLENPQLQDVALRQAMFTAIDRVDIGNRNYGRYFPDWSVRNNYSSWLDDDPFFVDHISETGYGTGDVEAAREILANAGYEGYDGEAGSLTLNGEPIGPFRLRTTETASRSTSVTLVQEHLAQIGIQADIEFAPNLGILSEGDYDIAQFGWSGSPAFFLTNASQFAYSESGSNFGKYNNPAYDTPALAVLGAPSLEEAARLTNEAYEILVPDAYILPLYWTPGTFFVRDNYVNIRNNGRENHRALYNIGEWAERAE